MTVKQLTADIKRVEKELARVTKNHEEMLALRGFSVWEKDIEHEAKLLAKYKSMLPEVKAEEEAKMLKKIAKQQIANKVASIGYIDEGNGRIKGITPNGKNWFADLNWFGYTERTLHCFTLRIAGEIKFTSGTLDTVLQTVAQN